MTKPEINWTIDNGATLKDIKAILGYAELLAGNGRFVLTVESDNQSRENYLFHHFMPTAYSLYENAKLVGRGSLMECVEALGDYVRRSQGHTKPYTQEEVAATLGIELPNYDRRATILGRDNLEEASRYFSSKAGPDMEPYFREGWHACVSGSRINPYLHHTHGDENHAWNEGLCAADRYLSAPI